MKKATNCQTSPAQTLAITAAPLRELLNFLTYCRNREMLNERARFQPSMNLAEFPLNILELKKVLAAKRCESGRKLYFDCLDTTNHRSVLIDNLECQFWVHYSRCGIGFVSITCFSTLAAAIGSVAPMMIRTVDGTYEFQWFLHDLGGKYFQENKEEIYLKQLGKYFTEKVNPKLISPYAILTEQTEIAERYKFVQGSLEDLRTILKRAIIVCEGIKRKSNEGNKHYVGRYFTITCGSIKNFPSVEHSTEHFLNQIAALAIRENVPFAVMRESYYRGGGTIFSDCLRKNRQYIFLNFDEEIRRMTPREKIIAQFYLVEWLKGHGSEGRQIIKFWKLD